MQFIPWALTLITGVLTGAATCGALVLPRRWLGLMGAAGGLSVVGLLLGVVTIWSGSSRADALVASLFISAGAVGGGYALVAALLPGMKRPAPSGVSSAVPSVDPRMTSTVLLADAEPESYDPRSVASTMAWLEEGGIPLPPTPARPLVYAAERARYDQAGGSPARSEVRRVATRLAEVLEGRTEGVSVAYCGGGPSLSEAVSFALAAGAGRVMVVPLTVAWSPEFEAAMESIHGSRLGAEGVSVTMADPLWGSKRMATMVIRSVTALLGEPVGDEGIVLVTDGSPWQPAAEDRSEREQINFFIQRVRAGLIEAGLPAERIRQAALDWDEPDVAEAARHLAAVGCRRIALVPVTFVVDTLSTVVDLRIAAERAVVEAGVEVAVHPAWSADPKLIDVLRESIDRAMSPDVSEP